MEDRPFEKLFGTYPMELNPSSNVISMNALNPIVAHVKKSKLGEASFYESDLFSSSDLVEKICSDNTLSPICDNSSNTESILCVIPVEIVGKIMNECYV